MNLTEHDINGIVGEVVRRLTSLGASSPTPVAAKTNQQEVVISDKLVTAETLRGRLTGITAVRVTARALVTPAARDELKQRKIALVRGSEQTPASATVATTNLLAANLESDYRTETLARLVASYGATLEQRPQRDLAQLVATHAQAITRQAARSVWFTSQPAYAASLANRHDGVWAVVGHDAETLRQASANMPVNLLVIDPAKKSQTTLRQLLELFVR
ncbi:MAG TPA: hypothetical protein VL096_19075 [Pirellulaceae bacterium]|nr:hypothetical protein [Pirellulaceae bacterium]